MIVQSDIQKIAGSAAATAAAGILKVGLTDGSGTSISSANNALYIQVRDAAGNARGANVNSSNQLSVSVDGVSATLTVQPGNTANTTPWLTSLTPGTTGGWTPKLENNLGTTVQTVKSGAGELGWYMCLNGNGTNINTNPTYIQIFDTSGTVTLGTTTPVAFVALPASSGANVEFSNGLNFANAIKIAATTTATGSTAPTNNVDCSFGYK